MPSMLIFSCNLTETDSASFRTRYACACEWRASEFPWIQRSFGHASSARSAGRNPGSLGTIVPQTKVTHRCSGAYQWKHPVRRLHTQASYANPGFAGKIALSHLPSRERRALGVAALLAA
jgi:hypothetical protein